MTSLADDVVAEEELVDVDPDLALLRAYEPVLRYTAGELFLPTSVEAYLAKCSLWADDGGSRRRRRVEELVAAGELTPGGLAAAGVRHRNRPLYLRFVQEQLTRAEVAAWRREDRPRLRGKARFAAVGVLARLIDAFVRLSLLVRGRVPGGLVAAAHRLAAAALAQAGEQPDRAGAVRTAYGRVLRTGGYTVLQYWYFYPFNDWRSTFYGVNDHEADWETISVYLVPDEDGDLAPAWVGASSHDLAGPDLRRRWDDPQLRREGDHPVIYPGAGSHSGAFLPGDYVVSVELPALRRVVNWLQHARRRLLPWTAEPGRGAFAIPFVDYARGDGSCDRSRTRADLAAGADRRRHALGARLPRPVGARHARPLRRRAGPRRAPLRAHGDGAPVVDGPAGLGRARRGARDTGGGGAAPAVPHRADRRRPQPSSRSRSPPSARPSAG